MRNTFIDAGPLIALFDRSDQYHLAAVRFMEGYQGYLWTTWPVLTEACHMLDFNIKSQIALLEWVGRGGIHLFDLNESHLNRIIALTRKFDDVPMDLADASLMVASEHTGYQEIASIDSDFYIYRNIRQEYLNNIFIN
ncbi:MAG: PIN domain-containing protein [Marinoscillum sp.]